MCEMHLRNVVTLVKISFVIITHISIVYGKSEFISETKILFGILFGIKFIKLAIKYPECKVRN